MKIIQATTFNLPLSHSIYQITFVGHYRVVCRPIFSPLKALLLYFKQGGKTWKARKFFKKDRFTCLTLFVVFNLLLKFLLFLIFSVFTLQNEEEFGYISDKKWNWNKGNGLKNVSLWDDDRSLELVNNSIDFVLHWEKGRHNKKRSNAFIKYKRPTESWLLPHWQRKNWLVSKQLFLVPNALAHSLTSFLV